MTSSPIASRSGCHSRGRVAVAAVLVFVVCGAACGGDPGATADSGWVVEHTTAEGGTPLVRNVSGSKWGGNATLVEELSIGVMEGPEEYMFGSTFAHWATDTEIYTLDGQDSRVKVFDRQGTFLRQFGAEGDGPGELRNPSALVVGRDGRVYVTGGFQSAKIAVFGPDGEWLEDWQVGGQIQGFSLVETPRGLFANAFIMPETPEQAAELRWGTQQLGPDGRVGEIELVPEYDLDPPTLSVSFGGRASEQPVPYSASSSTFILLPTGHLVHGAPTRYRFEIRDPDGGSILVERVTEPVAVTAEEKVQARKRTVAAYRRQDPDFDWSGAGIPDHKPWYARFAADHGGRLWVSREGPAFRVEDCDEDEQQPGGFPTQCWQPHRLLEVFDLDGSYLGGVERPARTSYFAPFIRGDLFVAGSIEDDGTPVVKVFRLVLPTAEEPTEPGE